jgi:hypothetical protein
MIARKQVNRLGHLNGIQAIKNHAWLKNFPWKELSEKKIRAPFIP